MKNFKHNFLKLIDGGANQAKSLVESFNDLIESFDVDAHLSYLNDRKKELIKRSNELFSDFTDLLKQVKENLTDFSVTVPFDETTGEKISYEVVDGSLNIEVTYSDETSTRNNRTSVLIPANCDLETISMSTNSMLKTATITIAKKFNEPKSEDETETAEEGATVEETNVLPKYFCETLGTLLYEDEVENGVSVRGGYPVVEITEEEAKEYIEEMRKKYAPKKPKVKTTKKKVAKKTKVKTKKKVVVEASEGDVPSTEAENDVTDEPTEEGGEVHISSKLAQKLKSNMSKYSTVLNTEGRRFVRKTPNA